MLVYYNKTYQLKYSEIFDFLHVSADFDYFGFFFEVFEFGSTKLFTLKKYKYAIL